MLRCCLSLANGLNNYPPLITTQVGTMTNASNGPDNGNNSSSISELDNAQNAQQFLAQKQTELGKLDKTQSPLPWAKIQLDIAEALVVTEQKPQAWQIARECFDIFLQHEAWQEAVEACNVLYQTEQAASLSALGQGIWLAVTYPIEADTTVVMLHHVVDDTPKNADGAAVAAAMAHYIAKLRTSGPKQESLCFLTTHILGEVAQQHSGISGQSDFDAWLTRLQLDQAEILLPRMGKIIDIMVGENWWFDRDELRARLPVN